MNGFRCPSLYWERLGGVFGYGVGKGVRELMFWGAPGDAFASPWADSGCPLGLRGSPLGELMVEFVEKQMKKQKPKSIPKE